MSPRSRRLGILLVLVAGVAAIYGQALSFDFVHLDDNQYVYANPHLQKGLTWDALVFAFSKNDYVGGLPPHPLTWISHTLDVEFFGLDARGHHATSLALHALNAVLLFAALRALTGSTWRSAAAASLWAWHPLRVESVAWVSERKDVLSGVFTLLTLWCYARFARHGSSAARWGTIGCFALGLMSKPTTVPLPFVLLLLDFWPLARWRPLRRALLEKAPPFGLSLIASLVTLDFNQGWTLPSETVPLIQRIANAVVSIAAYLEMFLWPRQLVPLYPHPYLPVYGGVPPSAATIQR